MNKYKYLLLTIFLSFILLPTIAYADCTEEEMAHFEEIEDEYKVTYEFNKENKNYDVTFYEKDRDKFEYITDFDSNLDYEKIDDTRTICRGVEAGEYNLEIVGRTETCDIVFKEKKLTLPAYNKLYEDPLCEGIEEFVLCQPTYDKNITYEDFVARVNVYKKNKANKKEEVSNQDEVINSILDYIKNYLFQIIAVVVFVAVVIITIILTAKSMRKSRRLE